MASRRLKAVFDDCQRAAIEAPANVVVTACPGSGKTTLVVGKVIRELAALEDTARGVLCLTYTNAAVQSIKDKLRNSIGDSNLPGCVVSTIHGFVLRQIFQPYSRLLGFTSELKLVGPTSIEYENYVTAAFPTRPTALQKIRYIRRGIDGAAVGNDLPAADVSAFWELLEAGGLVDFPSLLYYGMRLVSENLWIATSLGARYGAIIIDEYQDTSELALQVLERIRTAGQSRFLLVGDPRQRIYSFAGVTAQSLRIFADALEPERLGLTGSYRCGAAICADGSSLMPKPSAFHSNRCKDDDASITEILIADNIHSAVTNYFLPRVKALGIPRNEVAILASANKPLLALGASLRVAGISATGAPTRSYEETSFSVFAEAFAAFSRRPKPKNWRILETAFNRLFAEAEEDLIFLQFGSELRESLNAVSARALQVGSTSILDVLDGVVADLVSLAGRIDFRSLSYITDRWLPVRKELESFDDILTALAEQSDSRNSVTLSTIHGAKGLEYRAVALIQFNDGVLPHAYSGTEAEDRRKVFVALTRALDYVLYVSDTEDRRNRVSRFASSLLARRVY